MKEKIKRIVCDFVEQNYGKAELETPSWNIDLLAKYIDEELYGTQEEIKNTIRTLLNLLDIVDDYDDLLKILSKGTYDNYSTNINQFYEDDEEKSTGFDLDLGLMGFTIYRTEDNGCRLCENASYYEYDEEDDYTDTIDIKINDYKGE